MTGWSAGGLAGNGDFMVSGGAGLWFAWVSPI